MCAPKPNGEIYTFWIFITKTQEQRVKNNHWSHYLSMKWKQKIPICVMFPSIGTEVALYVITWWGWRYEEFWHFLQLEEAWSSQHLETHPPTPAQALGVRHSEWCVLFHIFPVIRQFLCTRWFIPRTPTSFWPFLHLPAACGILGSELFLVNDSVTLLVGTRGKRSSRPPGCPWKWGVP